MLIRLATKNDYLSICRSLQNKGQYWNTPKHIKKDIELNRLYIAVDNGKIIGQVALEYKEEFNYTGIVRLCVYNKKNCNKGIASHLMGYVCNLGIDNLGGTSFIDNIVTRSLFEKFNFQYQYNFLNDYCFYLKRD